MSKFKLSDSIKNSLFYILIVYGIFLNASHAAIVIAGTRIIYPSTAEFVAVNIDNVGDEPVLVQAWVESENERQNPSQSVAPFIVTPPLVTVGGKRGQALRIMFNHKKALPQDRESIFFFNLLDVPAKPKYLENYLQFAVRSTLKLFYRPSSIQMTQIEAFKQLKVSFVDGKLQLENPTPYYFNFGKRTLLLKDGSEFILNSFSYIEPFSAKIVSDVEKEKIQKIELVFINDHGGTYDFNKSF